jgi:hypothetical protein
MSNIPGFRTEEEEAARFNKAPRTLQLWRKLGSGPPYIKVGSTILYPIEEGEKWLRDQVQQPVRSRPRSRRRAAHIPA